MGHVRVRRLLEKRLFKICKCCTLATIPTTITDTLFVAPTIVCFHISHVVKTRPVSSASHLELRLTKVVIPGGGLLDLFWQPFYNRTDPTHSGMRMTTFSRTMTARRERDTMPRSSSFQASLMFLTRCTGYSCSKSVLNKKTDGHRFSLLWRDVHRVMHKLAESGKSEVKAAGSCRSVYLRYQAFHSSISQ